MLGCGQAKHAAEEAAKRAQDEAAAARKKAESLALKVKDVGWESLEKAEAAVKEALDKVWLIARYSYWSQQG